MRQAILLITPDSVGCWEIVYGIQNPNTIDLALNRSTILKTALSAEYTAQRGPINVFPGKPDARLNQTTPY